MSDTPIWDQMTFELARDLWARELHGTVHRFVFGFETVQDKEDRYRER